MKTFQEIKRLGVDKMKNPRNWNSYSNFIQKSPISKRDNQKIKQ